MHRPRFVRILAVAIFGMVSKRRASKHGNVSRRRRPLTGLLQNCSANFPTWPFMQLAECGRSAARLN